ncbi:restriction endonuclease [Lactococcus nasutitermitis]|uniref:Restriction endonuclease n=1 Tax=Lactococcus nasutitermitis TaxID=1652957 RepID=A0ABV9JES1_9LACT|nr:restriction endonuclease [Lactococcus nasutitermitis]
MSKYNIKQFEALKSYDGTVNSRECLTSLEILKYLKATAGKSTKKEFIQHLLEIDDIIPAEYVTKEYLGKNGTFKYLDFNYQFARKNLIIAGYLKDERGVIELTQKGFEVELNHFDFPAMMVQNEENYWGPTRQAKQKNKQKKLTFQEETTFENEADNEELDLEDWKIKLTKALQTMSPKKFEDFARLLVKNMGVTIDPVKGVQVSNDGGIDGFGYMVADDFRTNRVGIQAKRWQNNVGRVEIQNFIGALSTNLNQAEYGIFVTTSYFNKNAIETARSSTIPITLINIDDVCDLVAKYEIFVKPVTIYELDDFYFNE